MKIVCFLLKLVLKILLLPVAFLLRFLCFIWNLLMEREAKERERLGELYEDCDGRFAFIAGYTDGGAPYGVMWEEVGIDPGLPFEEKVKLYHMQMLG